MQSSPDLVEFLEPDKKTEMIDKVFHQIFLPELPKKPNKSIDFNRKAMEKNYLDKIFQHQPVSEQITPQNINRPKRGVSQANKYSKMEAEWKELKQKTSLQTYDKDVYGDMDKMEKLSMINANARFELLNAN